MPLLCPARSAINPYEAAGLAEGDGLALAEGLGLGDGLAGAGFVFGDEAGELAGDAFGLGEVDPVPPEVSPDGASVPGALLPAVKVCLPP